MEEEKKEQIEQFKENVEKKWLVINRIDPTIRKEFTEFANMDFCGDYGAALYEIFTQFKEYQFMKGQIFGDVGIKLNYIINLLDEKEVNKDEKPKHTFLSGKKV